MKAGSIRKLARLAAALLVGAAACQADRGEALQPPEVQVQAPADSNPLKRPGEIVDSILPIAEAIRRFQAEFGPDPGRLEGYPTRDALVARFVEVVERADTAGLIALPLTAAEFGFLYYPHTRFTAPPYELAPDLLWFQQQNTQSRGATRLLRRFAGAPLGYLGYRCEETARSEGPNRLWEECRVQLRGQAGDTVAMRLFGSVIERDGAFRLVSLSNDL
jgi:hypothetical protein